jgi:hypothetical protein
MGCCLQAGSDGKGEFNGFGRQKILGHGPRATAVPPKPVLLKIDVPEHLVLSYKFISMGRF